MSQIKSVIDKFRKSPKPVTRLDRLLKITIHELPYKGAQIEFRVVNSGQFRHSSYLYQNKSIDENHILSGLKRYCTIDGCCNSNRKITIYVDEDDFKNTGRNDKEPADFLQSKSLKEAIVVELKHGVQLYLNKEVSIHGRKSQLDSQIIHSQKSNNEFSCYPRIVSYTDGNATGIITTINKG